MPVDTINMNNNARDLEKAQALAAAQGAKEAKAFRDEIERQLGD